MSMPLSIAVDPPAWSSSMAEKILPFSSTLVGARTSRVLPAYVQSATVSDTVALCTYAGSTREVLAPTSVEEKGKIFSAIDELQAGGSTAMESGIDIAYRLAAKTRVAGHVNRVIVLSDGDANVGSSSHEEILKLIKSHKDAGITLSTVGFGAGNYKDT